MSRHIYAVQNTPKGWIITVETVEAGRVHKPTQLGAHRTRKAALTVARLLAGWRDQVVEFRNA